LQAANNIKQSRERGFMDLYMLRLGLKRDKLGSLMLVSIIILNDVQRQTVKKP